MFKTQAGQVQRRVIPLLMLFSCAFASEAANAGNVPIKVDETPVLVHFNAAGCPTAVSQVVNSCANVALPAFPAHAPGYPGEGLPVCREKGNKVTWIAVTDGAPGKLAQNKFYISFTPTNPVETKCKESSNGVLKCKVKADAHGYSEYTVVSDVATCKLDPRFYVPQG